VKNHEAESGNGTSQEPADTADAAAAVPAIPVPKVAATVPASDAAPVRMAAETAVEIERGSGISRIRQSDGWAWIRDGQVICTATHDGREVAYFRGGDRQPYWVQRGD
jgi:hypothetical protein